MRDLKCYLTNIVILIFQLIIFLECYFLLPKFTLIVLFTLFLISFGILIFRFIYSFKIKHVWKINMCIIDILAFPSTILIIFFIYALFDFIVFTIELISSVIEWREFHRPTSPLYL